MPLSFNFVGVALCDDPNNSCDSLEGIVDVRLRVIVFILVFNRDNEQKQRLLERQHPVYTGW